MMSLQSIKQANRERAAEAAAENLTPYVYFDTNEVDAHEGFPFPHLGDYEPYGWELVDEHFVDATGLGSANEPALTVNAFRELIKSEIRNAESTLGWAIVEAGQFQVYVGQFVRDNDQFRESLR